MSGVHGNLKSRPELMRRNTAYLFDENWEVYDNWFDEHPAVFRSEIRAIKKVMPARGRGLEIGVGTGRFASLLSAEFGLDPSLNMLKTARERKVKIVREAYPEELTRRITGPLLHECIWDGRAGRFRKGWGPGETPPERLL